MTDPRTALEEAFDVVWPRVHGKAYEQWSATHTRFRRFLDAEAWESAALMLVLPFVDAGWSGELGLHGVVSLRHPTSRSRDVGAVFHECPALALAAACIKAKEAGDGR